MYIRRADHSDIRRVAELWVHSFPERRTLAERMHTLETAGPWGGIETVHVAGEGDTLSGAIKLLPFKQYFGAATLSMMGLAAVAVSPAARRRGVGGALCEYALRVSAEMGSALSVLFPFRPSFYARFGWTSVGALHRYRFRPESLAARHAPVRIASPEDEAGIRACYDRVARKSNGMVARGRGAWRQHLDASATWAYVHGSDAIDGYVLVRYGTAGSAERRPLIVRELVASDDGVRHALLGWISLQRDLWRRVQYDAFPDERFDLLLEDPRAPGFRPARSLWAPAATILRGPMLRIVDIKTALEGPTDWPGEGEFSLTVRDPQLARNEGSFRVTWAGGRASVEHAEPAGGSHLALDIATLSGLFGGEVTVEEAVRHGGAEATGEPGAIEAFFGVRRGLRLLDVF